MCWVNSRRKVRSNMKATIEKETSFKPVSIRLTFETQDELDRFGSLCNTVGPNKFSLINCKLMESAGADIHKYVSEIVRSMRG